MSELINLLNATHRASAMSVALANTPAAPPTCHFYRLSAELRNEIYILALFPQPKEQRALEPLLSTNTTLDDPHSYEVSLSNPVPYTTPPLLHTSRRLRIEASGIFYSNVVFFKHAWHEDGFQDDIGNFQKMLASLRPQDRDMVHKVRLETHSVRNGWPELALELLSYWSDLEGIHTVREVLEVPIRDLLKDRKWEYRKVKDHQRQCLVDDEEPDKWLAMKCLRKVLDEHMR